MVEIDDTQLPILLTRWSGETTRADLDLFFPWLHDQIAAAQRDKRRIAIVAVGATLRADPDVRRRLTEETARLPQDPPEVAGTWLVVDSGLVRGIFTALRWFSPAARNTRMTASLDEALAQARQALR